MEIQPNHELEIGDSEIQTRVEAIAGKNAKIVECVTRSSNVTKEVLLINGQPVEIEGELGERIKECLRSGEPPPPELVAQLLQSKGPVEVESTVKSSIRTTDVTTLSDSKGEVLREDEKVDQVNTETRMEAEVNENKKDKKKGFWGLFNCAGGKKGKKDKVTTTVTETHTREVRDNNR